MTWLVRTDIVPATSYVQQGLPANLTRALLQAYGPDCAEGIPSLQTLGGQSACHLPKPYGATFRRAAAYIGDLYFIANRRLTCQTWAAANLTTYCYRFNAIPAGIPWPIAVTHFQEVSFVFNNLQGLGYVTNPFKGKPQSYADLSYLMSKSWASFVYDLDVNGWKGRNASVPAWPRYNNRNPMNFVFDANVTSHSESDTFRAEGIRLINENLKLYRR